EIGFVVRNSTVLKETEQLRDGDVVLILPFVLGG
ncbi:molybdopterin converting factor subunit 1, partial [Coprothermobacter proteolyticus]|nr:molybdopterin converting factor subunit 1 [Coprothermobacter proteolyticus]